jgi:RNA polymerase sigma-70 factor (ECF subfamily)
MTRVPEKHVHEIADLYCQTAADLHRFACRASQGDAVAADDLVQETFHDAASTWRSLRTLTLDRQRAWLFRVLKNKAITRWRRSGRTLDIATVEGLVTDTHDTHNKVLNAIALNQCWEVLSAMSPRQFECAYLRWHEEWLTSEIATHLGISQSTVRVHLKNARDELTKSVGPEVVFLDDPDTDSSEGVRRGEK